MKKNNKKERYEIIVVSCILIASNLLLYMSRNQEGMLFFSIGFILFVVALLVIHWVDKR